MGAATRGCSALSGSVLTTLAVFGLLAPVQRTASEDGPLRFEDLLPPEVHKKYDKMKPPKSDGKPTEVGFHVTVMQLDSINENSMTYVADIFFAQSWKDHRLHLPENMTSDYRLLNLDWLNDIWRPDSFFKNAKSVTFQTMTVPNHYVWLHADKSILYMVKLTLTLSCAMNFALYPHDYQECRLQMESLSYTTDDLVFVWEKITPLVVDENIELPQLDLVNNYTDDCTHVYPTGNFTCLEVVFKFKRRLGYYLFHTYIPTCLIVIMSWISFWIKPEAAPARVTLGVTSLLTLSTQHAKSQSALPPVSYVKSIDSFMNACTVFVFLALMEYALVNIVLGDSPEPPSKPGAGGPGTSAGEPPRPDKIYHLAARENARMLTGRPPKPPGLSKQQVNRRRAIIVDRVSRVLFPATFLMLNVTYWLVNVDNL
ncbi:glycine receptor subunit alpha-2-like [Amphibalanus amphitrite]|uniref:glycine receptor subunit alpha-2-like n=1 Tax=Amphibalanus amphitrite TaxID=1232801 RepID=UPI001C902589|nr:glycine receptor subunit alpha-2-like [Amphibalanus amphitrite]